MNQASPPTTVREHRLELKEVLDQLVADGVVNAADAERTLQVTVARDRAERHPLSIIADRRLAAAEPPHKPLTLDVLTQWLAERVGLPFYRIDPFKIDVARVCNLVSHAYATRFKILPVAVTGSEVVIATAEPFLRDWESTVSQVLRLKIARVVASPEDILRYLGEFYNLARSVKRAQEAQQGATVSTLANFEQLVELGRSGQLDANDRHVVHIVDWLMQYAYEQRASDIHIEPRRETANVRFRIDGVMHLAYQVPMPVMQAITSRIKLLGRMDMVEKRRPQDGRVKTKTPDGEEIELRLSTMPTAFGEKLVMRIFSPEVLVRSFKELGFGEEEGARWNELTHQPSGIVLVTGPTGSGKTTTLYTTLRELATPEVNVCTVEDPIEMVVAQFNQMQVQHGIGLGFAEGVRTLLRQDPDVIMVGEVRDLETAEMAVQAALTGHLVVSTLHTNDAPSAVTRMLDLGVPPYLINATVLGVMAQRLVRTLCPHCKQPAEPDVAAWQELVRPWKAPPPKQVFAPGGCLECRMTGYRGRIGIYELMSMSSAIRRLVQPGADLAAIRDVAYKEGMKALRISGAQKVAAGLTTVSEVLKVAPPAIDD